ncbi:MAG: hypothetical protein JJ899_07385 [Alphaproteobacteria bacterium]|nr:hypothetical protein [Alphaproteobacteria bacterium]
MLTRSGILGVAAAAILAACTTYTGSTDNPIERSLTWFSYVAGDDIRASCTAGSRDHFRFVYNANYEQQVRAYDLQGVEGGADYLARARNRPGNVARFQFSNPLGPWELDRSTARLTNAQAATIIDAFGRDAAAAPDPAGQQVKSNEYYWIVSSCNAGTFRIWVFDQDRVDLSGLAFVPELRAFDETGVAFREARRVEGFDDGAFYIKINSTADGTVRGL